MPVTLLLTLLVLAVVAAVAAVATGRIAGGLDDPVSSLPGRLLPDDAEISAVDVERVRFSPALRGYRMEEVDRTVDRLTEELARREEVIARLLERLGDTGEVPESTPVGAPVLAAAGSAAEPEPPLDEA